MKEKLRNSGEDNLVQLSVDLREDINNMDINMAMDMDIGMDMDMDMDMDMHGSDRGESSVNAGDITVAAGEFSTHAHTHTHTQNSCTMYTFYFLVSSFLILFILIFQRKIIMNPASLKKRGKTLTTRTTLTLD
jgi:hypothetical protein